MAFAATTKAKLIKELSIDKRQIMPGSTLSVLMTEAETFDTKYSTSYVTDIETALTTIEGLNTTIAAKASKDNIKSIGTFRRIDIEYFTPGSGSAEYRKSRQSQVSLIKRLLDPNNLLEAFYMEGRVIETL